MLFTFIDPGDLVELLNLPTDPMVFRIKAYAGGFFFFWLLFITSTYLNCYFGQLQNKEREEEASRSAKSGNPAST